jgi:hypothetical protein
MAMEDFNEQVKAGLLPLLSRYGFSLDEEFAGFLRFRTNNVQITITCDSRTNEETIFLAYKVDGHHFEEFDFNYALQILEPTNEPNLSVATEGADGRIAYYRSALQTYPQILKGSREFLGKLRIHFQESVDRYNLEISGRQLSAQANDAWSRKQYGELITLLEPFEDKLSAVDSKRLRLARKYTKN